MMNDRILRNTCALTLIKATPALCNIADSHKTLLYRYRYNSVFSLGLYQLALEQCQIFSRNAPIGIHIRLCNRNGVG